jgi:hypothetical protein
MNEETEDEWEEKCRKEVAVRDEKTKIFGVLSDRNLRGYMTNYGILISIDNEHEDWSKVLSASIYAEKVRELIGLESPDYSRDEIPATSTMD